MTNPVCRAREFWIAPNRRQVSAREDVLADPIHAPPVSIVGLVGDGDGLQRHPSTGFEEPIAGCKIVVEVTVADSLQHFDRDDRVIRARDVAVIHQTDIDQVAETLLLDPALCKPRLFYRQGQSGDPTTELAGSVFGKPAPSAPDLEDMVALVQVRPFGDAPVLGMLRPLQPDPRLVEQPR